MTSHEALEKGARTVNRSNLRRKPRRFLDESGIRRLIEDRYGDAISPEDVAALVPIVRTILENSARLSEIELGETDPRSMWLAVEPDVGR